MFTYAEKSRKKISEIFWVRRKIWGGEIWAMMTNPIMGFNGQLYKENCYLGPPY
jgi:hypothetical protein